MCIRYGMLCWLTWIKRFSETLKLSTLHSVFWGRLIVWDKKSESRRAILPLDARGVGQIIAVDNLLYVGCKCPYTSKRSLSGGGLMDVGETNTKSKLYIINASEFQILEVRMSVITWGWQSEFVSKWPLCYSELQMFFLLFFFYYLLTFTSAHNNSISMHLICW